MEEEIERVNSERVKVLSQLYCNNEEMKRIKAEYKRIKSLESKEEMKRLDGVSESESLKEAMKRLDGVSESESESESEAEFESESESESESEADSESLEEEMKRLYEESESESLKEALKRLNAESNILKQERDRLKSIYEDLTKKKMEVEVEVEEEIERINSERIKVLSQLYCNNKALEGIKAEFKRIKSPLKSKEMKQLSALSLSESESLESLKEAMKRLNAESKCLNQERDRLKSIYEHLKRTLGTRNPSKKTLGTRSRATFKRTANI